MEIEEYNEIYKILIERVMDFVCNNCIGVRNYKISTDDAYGVAHDCFMKAVKEYEKTHDMSAYSNGDEEWYDEFLDNSIIYDIVDNIREMDFIKD